MSGIWFVNGDYDGFPTFRSVRRDHVQGATPDLPQYQPARVWMVIGLVFDRLPVFQYVADILGCDASLKHPSNRMDPIHDPALISHGEKHSPGPGGVKIPYYHYLDVMGGGHFKNDPELVYTLVMEAPSVLKWLEELGAMFTKFPDGRMKSLHGGGTSRRRMHYAADITGAEIMRTIRDEAQSRPGIEVLEFSPAVELVLDERGATAGAVLYDLETEEYFTVKAKSVILATGGSGRLHIQGFMTTNHYGATGDGLMPD